ncbi:MAG: DUF2304 domain-containing protein [Lentisphaerae bacterium]|jgi:hypothetical protein|nr:DUF2304 domain-containing protein [Lentisphaerota bacterium]
MRRWLVAGCIVMALLLAVPGLMQASQMTRIRMLMAGVSVGVFIITILAIRGYKLREKYAFLWLATAGMIFLVACFPELVERVRHWFGMQYVTSLVAVIFVFLVLVSFHFSIALSALNDKAAGTAARSAIHEARIHELERRIEALEAAADQKEASRQASETSGTASSG